MNPLICQIKAIADLSVSDDGVHRFRVPELLSIRLALADALSSVDAELRWRREEQRERRGQHSEETA